MNIYFDPSHTASYGGVEKLSKATKLGRNQVADWLSGHDAYTLHKQVRRKFKRNQIFVNNIADQFQCDLNDMRHLAKFNDNYKYIFVCIDCFSRYAWAIPLLNKTGGSVKRALQEIFKESKPIKVQSDKGGELLRKKFRTI